VEEEKGPRFLNGSPVNSAIGNRRENGAANEVKWLFCLSGDIARGCGSARGKEKSRVNSGKVTAARGFFAYPRQKNLSVLSRLENGKMNSRLEERPVSF